MEHAMSARGLANSDHVHSQFTHNYRAHVNIICFIKVKIVVLIYIVIYCRCPSVMLIIEFGMV